MHTISKRNFTWDEFLKTSCVVEGSEGRNSPHGGRHVPFELLTRDAQAGVFPLGGALVESPAVDKTLVGPLRAVSVCAALGAEIRTGLIPSTAIPVVTGDFSAQWLGEVQTASPGDLTVGQALLTPHRVVIGVTSSKLLSVQASPDFGASLAREASAKLFQSLDFVSLTGIGNAQPLGILNTVGVGTVTFGGSATWSKILSFESIIGNANANGPGASLGWAQSPNTRAKWKAAPRGSGLSIYLQQDDNRVAGYPALMTTELNSTNANDRCIFGNWSDFVIGVFGDGVWVVSDPYTKSATGEDSYVFTMYADCGCKHPASFVQSLDSAAQ